MEPVKINSVNGQLGEKLNLLWKGNLSVLNWEEDFLVPFRQKNAEVGLRSGGYIGLGKTLSGLIHAARHLGGEADLLRKRIVNELLHTQETDGYIGIYELNSRTYKVWDVHEQSYIIQALVENARWFGDRDSLQAADRLGRWLLPRLTGGRWKEVGKDFIWNPLATLGLDRAFQALSQAAGDSVFEDFCKGELGVVDWYDPIVEGRQGEVCGQATSYIARCLAQLEMDHAANALPEATQAVIGYLRAGGGLVVSGTCGHHECWHSDQKLDGDLGETCTTAYLVRWAAHLLRRTHNAWFGDLMERSIYNALFAATSVDGRRIRYYSSAEGKRKWYDADTYCCTGNYRRIIGELPDFIARPHNDGLAIDLYESCKLTLTIGGHQIRLGMTTAYPFDNQVVLELEMEQSVVFPIYLRNPRWAKVVHVRCNGEVESCKKQDGWLVLERNWQCGDRLNLTFDMPWRLIRGFRKQLNKVAIMRGPLVWGADPALNESIGYRLPDIIPDISTCRLTAHAQRAIMMGEMDGQNVEVTLIPFAELNTAVTYFTGRRGMGDECDHLLHLAPDPIGVGRAPGT